MFYLTMYSTHFIYKKEMFYLTMHSTHFIYGYIASDIWFYLQLYGIGHTVNCLSDREETCFCHYMGYSFLLV